MELLSRLLDDDRIDPQAPAVTDGRQSIDYGELIDRCGRLAAALVEAGVEPGDRVGIHLHKSIDSMVAVHASLRAGAVHVPLDPLAPIDYIATLVRDCDISVLITDGSGTALNELARVTDLSGIIGPDQGPATLRVIPWAAVADLDSATPVGVASDDPAYIIYTSGSTGAPKGILHTHASGLAYARLAAATYGLEPRDRLANIAPLHFDQSTFELFAAPFAGSSVLMVPEPVLRFPASLTELIEREQITVWYSVPYLLMQVLERGALDQRNVEQLRWVLFGGEVFPPGQLGELMARWPHARFSNVYGPAEVNQCTYFHLDEPPVDLEAVPIGRAWDETELVVVDETERIVEPGTPGQLLVHTSTMMDCYWNRPEMTAGSFRVRPTASGEEARWYLTGDQVVEGVDGNLVFLGRADHQVKIRGHRVELEAIESALLDLDGVAEAAAVDRGGDELIAMIVPSAPIDHRQLLATLGDRLPKYAIPTEIIEVESLPRTGTAKIDRQAARKLLYQIQ